MEIKEHSYFIESSNKQNIKRNTPVLINGALMVMTDELFKDEIYKYKFEFITGDEYKETYKKFNLNHNTEFNVGMLADILEKTDSEIESFHIFLGNSQDFSKFKDYMEDNDFIFKEQNENFNFHQFISSLNIGAIVGVLDYKENNHSYLKGFVGKDIIDFYNKIYDFLNKKL